MAHRYRAPTAHGAVLAEPHFDALPGLVEANRRLLNRSDVLIGGLPLRDLRALARREVLELARESTDSPALRAGLSSDVAPLLLAGHQPELSHPGVWVKNFALNGLARRTGGIPLNLIVDNDTLKSTSLHFPTFHDRDPHSVRMESLAFDTATREEPYEHRVVNDVEMFRTFVDRAEPLWSNWGYEPLLAKCWRNGKNVGEVFTKMRREREHAWGCENLELRVSRLSQTEAFARFVWQILTDLPRIQAIYNSTVNEFRRANRIASASHPVPNLETDGDWHEAPFWIYTGSPSSPRYKLLASRGASGIPYRVGNLPFELHPLPGEVNHFAAYVPKYITIRPRALTLTLFARVCLGDFFIHGIGGGKYDEVTDAIIRDYFGMEPPAYQVLSATLHLPLPGFPSTPDDFTHAERHVRDLHWNPELFLTEEQLANPDVKALVDTHARLAANEPPYREHAARKERFRRLQGITEKLRPLVAGFVPHAEAELTRVRSEVDANAILKRRDYSWVLYPEETLRPFLQRFL